MSVAGERKQRKMTKTREVVWSNQIVMVLSAGNLCYSEFVSFLKRIQAGVNEINEGVEQFNNSLISTFQDSVLQRVEELSKKRREEQELGLPPDEDELGDHIELPLVMIPKVNIESLSTLPTDKSELNYVLSISLFDQIVNSISRTAASMEKHYLTYRGLDEPNIRDIILAMLDGMLSVRTTGETFNSIGKTDILLPYKEHNVFIAECKIWKGSKKFTEGLGQLEGYLGWDDTKAVYLIFYRNSESMVNKISEMRNMIKSLPNYGSTLWETERGGRFNMKHPTDSLKNYLLELMVFNLPS